MFPRALRKLLRPFHPRNLLWLPRAFRERHFNHCHVLSRSPAIIYLWWGRDDTILHRLMQEKRLVLLYLFPWCTKREDIEPIAGQIKSRLKQFPGHRIVLLCNEEFTVEPFKQAGVEAVFCNQNAFVDEGTFQPILQVEKKFDAVYSASMAPYKRHLLAAGIESLMLMTYRYSGTHSRQYEKQVIDGLPQAQWIKNSYGDEDKVSAQALRGYYNMAKTGLCLSEIEGSMFASMEYLLCGLPVVSTPSIGGRDTFFDPDYVTVCEPRSEAVAEAVADLIKRDIPRDRIRSKTLQKMAIHRDTLRRLLADEISPAKLQIPWSPGSHGISDWTDLVQLSGELLAEGR